LHAPHCRSHAPLRERRAAHAFFMYLQRVASASGMMLRSHPAKQAART
jgi:hypothetical protein